MTFQDYLAGQRKRVDDYLSHVLTTDQPRFSRLYEAMNYSLLAGGKRIRPVLLLATVEALGQDASPYTGLACALECIHTYSLIHDDLPCMDDDDLRRGKPTNHVVYGAGLATLAGDGLLTFAFELMASQKGIAPDKLNRCIAVIARAAGPAGMVGGQAFDLASDGDMAIGREGMELLHRSKTGVIFKAAIDMAAIVADASPQQRQALEAYASYMGLTFQITDDILDVVGDDDELLARVQHGLEHRQDLLNVRDLLVRDEDERVVNDGFHLVVIRDHIRGDIALVELHALDDLGIGLGGLALLDGDDAVLADLLHRLGDELADVFVTGRDRADTRDVARAAHGLGVRADGVDSRVGRLLDAAAHNHRVRTGGQVLQTLADHRLRQNGGGGGAVARDVVGLRAHFADELRAHVLKRSLLRSSRRRW